VLSGPLLAGKSTLAAGLQRELAADVVSARDVLRDLADRELDTRRDLQLFGAAIEKATNGSWLATEVGRPSGLIVVDSARTLSQARAFKKSSCHSILIHLTASQAERRRRFEQERDSIDLDGLTFDEVTGHWLEARAQEVRTLADAIFDTSNARADNVLRAAVELIEHARA
jgi:cytidylate kinase